MKTLVKFGGYLIIIIVAAIAFYFVCPKYYFQDDGENYILSNKITGTREFFFVDKQNQSIMKVIFFKNGRIIWSSHPLFIKDEKAFLRVKNLIAETEKREVEANSFE